MLAWQRTLFVVDRAHARYMYSTACHVHAFCRIAICWWYFYTNNNAHPSTIHCCSRTELPQHGAPGRRTTSRGMRLRLLLFPLALAAALAPARCLPRTRYLRCCVEAGQADASSGSAAALECPIAVRAVRGKGLGAFAVAAVPAGARVCSYHGEALTQRRVAERYGAGAAAQADYLFELRPPSAEAEGLYVDAARSQHPSRFINHAEDGNLVPSPVGRPPERIDFYAARQIQPGEELCFDCARSLLSNRPSLAPDAHATRSATATRALSDFVRRARRWRALLGRAQRWARARVRYAMGGDSTSTPPWPDWSAAGRSATERAAVGTLRQSK